MISARVTEHRLEQKDVPVQVLHHPRVRTHRSIGSRTMGAPISPSVDDNRNREFGLLREEAPTLLSHASSLSSAVASLRSAVSKPSVNQSYTGASSSWAWVRLPWSTHSRAS